MKDSSSMLPIPRVSGTIQATPRQQQQQQPMTQRQDAPPRGYELQFQNPRYYAKGAEWLDQDHPSNVNANSATTLDYLQKEFLKHEYDKQQELLRRRKLLQLQQKEGEKEKQLIWQKELNEETQKDKLLHADQKKALAEAYQKQIAQLSRERQNKKQEVLEEDRRRIQAGENGMSRENEKVLQRREEIRKEAVRQLQTGRAQSQDDKMQAPQGTSLVQKQLQKQLAQKQMQQLDKEQQQEESFFNRIGRYDAKRIQQFERYEAMQAANEKNFVSFDEEKRKQAEVFANSLDYNPFRQANKQKERFEYGNALKKQIEDNKQRKENETNNQQKNSQQYQGLKLSDQPKENVVSQMQEMQLQREVDMQQVKREKEFDAKERLKQNYEKDYNVNRKEEEMDVKQIKRKQEEEEEYARYSKQRDSQNQQEQSYQKDIAENIGKRLLVRGKNNSNSMHQLIVEKEQNQKSQQYFEDDIGNNNNGSQQLKDQDFYQEFLDYQLEQQRIALAKEESFKEIDRKFNRDSVQLLNPNPTRQKLSSMGNLVPAATAAYQREKKIYNPITNSIQVMQRNSLEDNYRLLDYKTQQQQQQPRRRESQNLKEKNLLRNISPY